MKYDDYIEQDTPGGYMLRVNMRNGTFLAFRNGTPQSWMSAGVEIQIHPMLHAIFLGGDFRIQVRQDTPLIFFPMENAFVKIPFEYGEESEIRYMRIPQEYDGLDMLPGLVFHFPGYWPSVLPAIGDGRRYFIADQGIPRQNIMRIKGKYPRSRLIVFKPEEFMKVRIEREKVERGEKARAVDIVETLQDDAISQNPVFAARYFLRNLEWRKMYSIPLFTRIRLPEVEIILSFMEKMYKSASTSQDLRDSEELLWDLIDYYEGILAILTGDFARVKSWQRKHQTYKRVVLANLIAVCEFQKKYAQIDKNTVFATFLRDIHQILRNIPPKEIAA